MRAEDLEALREHMLAVIAAGAFALRDTIGKNAFDERVMTAMGKVPRHEFVPIELQPYDEQEGDTKMSAGSRETCFANAGNEPMFSSMPAAIATSAGLASVRVHNRWTNGWPVLVTILGWLFVLRLGAFPAVEWCPSRDDG